VVAIYATRLLTIVNQVVYLASYLVCVVLMLCFFIVRILIVMVGVSLLRVENL
jgi:hypothetical protein